MAKTHRFKYTISVIMILIKTYKTIFSIGENITLSLKEKKLVVNRVKSMLINL
jgi:hypothetical protein